MRTFRLGMPTTNTVVDVVVWNRSMVVEKELVGLSVIVKSVKIGKYKEVVNISTTHLSDIEEHYLYERYEDWQPKILSK